MKLSVALGLALSLVASAALAAQPVTITDPANASAAAVTGGNLHVNCITGCSGGGGGGAITAASGSYASGALSAGAIVDLGSGVSPAANTTNNYLQTLAGTVSGNQVTVGQGGSPWGVSAADNGIISLGAKADAAWSGTGSGSLIAIAKAQYAATIAPLAAQAGTGVDIGATETKYWGGTLLGAASIYGTSPGPVEVPGVNAFITNTPAVTGTVTAQFSTGNAATTPHICGSHVYKHITSATDTQLVAASGSTTIYVCDIAFSASAGLNFYLEKATSGTCATLTQIDMLWSLAANEAKTDANPYYRGLNTGASAQLCANTSAGNLDISVYYDQY